MVVTKTDLVMEDRDSQYTNPISLSLSLFADIQKLLAPVYGRLSKLSDLIISGKDRDQVFPELVSVREITRLVRGRFKEEKIRSEISNRAPQWERHIPGIVDYLKRLLLRKVVPSVDGDAIAAILRGTPYSSYTLLRPRYEEITQQESLNPGQSEKRAAIISFVQAYQSLYKHKLYLSRITSKMRLDIDRQDVHVLVQDIEQVGAHFSHSKDPTIKKILQSDSITLLSTFEKKRLFIQQLLGQIRTGSDEGMWESFFEVYRSMKTHISKIRNDFGDVVLADDLLHCYEDKATFGEQPLVWQKKFESIVRTLQDSATVRRLFFEASVTHLLRPLTARIDERVIEHHSQLQSAVSRSGGLKKKISRKGVRDLLIYLRQVERFYLAKIDSLKVLFTTRKQHLNALVTQFKETYTGEFNEESFLKKADLIIGDGMDVQEEIAKFSSTRDRFSVDDDRYRMQLIPAALQIATAVVAGNNRIAQGSLDMLEEGKDIVLLKDQASSISTELSQLVDDLDQTLGDGRERIRRWIDG